jgi:hypothetical protein
MKSFKTFIAEDLIPQQGTQYGSNDGGIHTDSDTGKQYYVKYYKNPDQAKTEALTGKLYNHMGINTLKPEYKVINGKHAIITDWNPNLRTMDPSEYEKLSPDQANDIGKMYHAATLTKNWDIVGLNHDNIMRHKNGDLHAIDHGGAFNFRAQGGHKDFGPDINENQSLRDNDGASGHVFRSAFRQYPEAETNSLDAVNNMDDKHVFGLFKNSGLANWQDLYRNFAMRKSNLMSKYKG